MCNTGYSWMHVAPYCAIVIFNNLTLWLRPGNKIWLLTNVMHYFFFFSNGCKTKIFSLKMNSERDIEFCITLSWLRWSQCYSKLVSVRIHRQEEGTTPDFGAVWWISGYVAKNLTDNKRGSCNTLTFPSSNGIWFRNYALFSFFRSWFWCPAIQIPFHCIIFCSLCSKAVSLKRRNAPTW